MFFEPQNIQHRISNDEVNSFEILRFDIYNISKIVGLIQRRVSR